MYWPYFEESIGLVGHDGPMVKYWRYWNQAIHQKRPFKSTLVLITWLLGDMARSSTEPNSLGRHYSHECDKAWWRHQMETFSTLLAICAGNSPVPGEFPAQRPVTQSFDVFFDSHLNKRLSKQPWGWWFETLPCPSWRHCNGVTTADKVEKVYTTDTMIHIFLYKKTAGHYYNVSVIVCDSLGGSLKMNSYISIIIITWLCRFLVWNCSCAQLQLPSSSRRVCCPRKCYKACKCYKGICATNTVSYNSYGRV